MKSRGENLDRAYTQAIDYFPGLKERDLPRYVLVCDFARFRLHDLSEGTAAEFPLADFHKNVRLFADALRAEFEKIRKNRNKLFEFHKKPRGLTFLDPTCGCGNFLAIAYRELRLLELGAANRSPFRH